MASRGDAVAGPGSTSLIGLETDKGKDSTLFAAAGSGETSEKGGVQAGGFPGGVDGEKAMLTAAEAVALKSAVGGGGGGDDDEDTDGGRGVAEDRVEEPLGNLVAVAAGDGDTSPPSPSSPGRRVGIGGVGGEFEGRLEPLDRAGSCGLWLRLVIMPLVVECLEGSYRTKLLVLHMAQVRGARRLRLVLTSGTSYVPIKIRLECLCFQEHVAGRPTVALSCAYVWRAGDVDPLPSSVQL